MRIRRGPGSLTGRSAMLATLDIFLRLVLSVLLGFLIGYSRRGKSAGVRTFSLIAIGATMFTIMSFAPAVTECVGCSTDPTRIIGQIVAGIGFLGLGVIWRQEGAGPHGLTTAAAIWVTASVGCLVGLGMIMESVLGTLLTLIILYSKKPLQEVHMD